MLKLIGIWSVIREKFEYEENQGQWLFATKIKTTMQRGSST